MAVADHLFSQPAFWVMLPLVVLSAVLPDIIVHAVSRELVPTPFAVILEWSRGYGSPLPYAQLSRLVRWHYHTGARARRCLLQLKGMDVLSPLTLRSATTSSLELLERDGDDEDPDILVPVGENEVGSRETERLNEL